ncbi:hypothetical protein PACTADRAFT_47391 [Pachysolen tannophilus NRRL Y-2460]|uniref:Dolichol kinase n=1 Tax=Pachysolen tannophilus NRRL Y-2460 TaxID=669874 RepID=A0A1E4U0F8_PACTA|nr:hypothetical protein PACTADRAFT_52152 [Pachysolen tannophilus NRRL Y-2460]ODV97479.1 hypothetical protein PACTADRAFT_47391 [Pachysolen tannophilus NRRL Y-2460]
MTTLKKDNLNFRNRKKPNNKNDSSKITESITNIDTSSDETANDPDFISSTKLEESSISTNSENSNVVENENENENISTGDRIIKELKQEVDEVVSFLQYHARFHNFIHKYEVPRKIFHSSIGFITLFLYRSGYELNQITPKMVTAFVVILLLDVIRFQSPIFNQLYVKAVGWMMREREVKNSYNGVLYYLLGIIITFSWCSRDIAVLSVLLLSWADTGASTFGRLYGKYTPKITKNKSLAGCIAAFIAGNFSLWIFNYMARPEDKHNLTLLDYILTGFIAAISEGIDIGIDDNLTIPVLSSLFLTLYRKFAINL